MIEAVIFDLDGTLVTTRLAFYSEVVTPKIEQQIGVSVEPDAMAGLYHCSDRDRYVAEVLQLDPDAFWPLYDELNCEHRLKFTRLYPDTMVLEDLAAAGISLGIVTASSQRTAAMQLDLLVTLRFDAVVSTHNGIPKKPDPHAVAICLEKMGTTADRALMVGDGEEDIGAAQNAGVADVWIDRGQPAPAKWLPSHRVQSLYELRSKLWE